MKVYAVRFDKQSLGLENQEVTHELGIRIFHEGKEYSISEDNSGRLVLRSINGVQLVLKPEASNSVRIESSHG